MLFNSAIFLFVFLPAVLFGYHHLQRAGRFEWALHYLLLASLVFYAWWNPIYLALIIGSMVVNYQLGEALRRQRKRWLLTLGVAFNLILIAIFKYAGFFAQSLDTLGADLPVPELVLPLAISFFTFQQIAYLVEAWRGTADSAPPLRYALFVVFFPQLIAGPIVHYNEMVPQFSQAETRRTTTDVMFAQGLFLITAGLFKKLIIADYLATWADPVFANACQALFFDAWVGALAYTFQLYFDFSGYSEMAMGLALLFGFRLPKNFDSPYRALNIADFWRRWHITLGRFLRNYLYIPLGGSRHGLPRTVMTLIVTMLLGGLWHGAGWTFVAWGGLHGLYLAIHYVWRQLPLRLPPAAAWLVTFLSVMVGWVLFRADSLADAKQLLVTLSGINGLHFPESLTAVLPENLPIITFAPTSLTVGLEPLLLVVLTVFVATQPNVHELWQARVRPNLRWALGTAGLASVAVSQLSKQSVFLYFQF
ncbi:MBOAT family O-acyltransferase [Thiolapillus sp.]|uniref:MBOAT family O-acyltransferase n=1 Tax=Thiolapillus sp. TaxID=2017437 RepID=UPI003AF759F9